MEKYFLILVLIVVGTAGQILLKTTANQLMPQMPEINSLGTLIQAVIIFLKNYKILSLILIYATGFFVWFLVLTKFDISYAFPVVLGIIYGLIFLFSWMFLKENITAMRLLGIITTFIGVILVARS